MILPTLNSDEPKFLSDFPCADAPRRKHSLLFEMKVFVENEHGS